MDYDLVVVGAGVMGLATVYEIAKSSNLKIACIDMGEDLLTYPFESITGGKTQLELCPPSINQNKINFHPSASYYASGILARDGAKFGTLDREASVFRSGLRCCLINSMASYSEWLATLKAELSNDIQNIELKKKIGLITAEDCHLYNVSDRVHAERLATLLERLKDEESNDGEVLDGFRLDDFLNEEILSIKNCTCVKFQKNYLIRPRAIMQGLIMASTTQGVDFFWNTKVEKVGGLDEVGITKNLAVIVKERNGLINHQNINTRKIIFATGWCFNHFNFFKKYNLRMKFNEGLVKVIPQNMLSRAGHFLKENTILRPGGRNYFIKTGEQKGQLLTSKTESCRLTTKLSSGLIEEKSSSVYKKSGQESIRFGMRSFSKDKKPVVGFIDKKKDWGVACGHSKMGWGMAPITASYLKNEVLGLPQNKDLTNLMSIFDPLRYS